ncbi:MAG: hypothetical protein GW921_04550, partial [Gallionella sp.]|nr:hypothetical protein [Gallionella sp.]
PAGQGALLAFKSQSTHIITGANAISTYAVTDLALESVDTEFGLVAPRSVVRAGNDIWWLSRKGVVSAAENDQQIVQRRTLPVSAPITNSIQRINWSAAHKAAAVWYNNYYLLSAPIDGATTNNAIFVFSFLYNCWVGLWTGLAVQKFIVARMELRDELFGIEEDGRVVKLFQGDQDYVQRNVQSLIFSGSQEQAAFSLEPTSGALGTDEGIALVTATGKYLVTA